MYRTAPLTLETLHWLCYMVAQLHAHYNKHMLSVKFSERTLQVDFQNLSFFEEELVERLQVDFSSFFSTGSDAHHSWQSEIKKS